MVVLPDDGPRYARNMQRVTKYTKNNLYPFSVHVVTFTFHYQLMHLLIKNTFTVHI